MVVVKVYLFPSVHCILAFYGPFILTPPFSDSLHTFFYQYMEGLPLTCLPSTMSINSLLSYHSHPFSHRCQIMSGCYTRPLLQHKTHSPWSGMSHLNLPHVISLTSQSLLCRNLSVRQAHFTSMSITLPHSKKIYIWDCQCFLPASKISIRGASELKLWTFTSMLFKAWLPLHLNFRPF